MSGQQPRLGIVLTGGGARAAYQAGVLRAVADLLPKGAGNPFPIICGASAGAINAVALAADAANYRRAARRLHAVWNSFRSDQVYRTDVPGVIKNSLAWIRAAVTGGRGHGGVSLLDNAPLVRLLSRRVHFPAVQRAIEAGDLYALAVTCSGYGSGHSVCFFQSVHGVQPWRRARRIGIPATIGLEHLLASSALPFIFPAVRIEGEYFGDGSMRQIAPISPALHLGADRVLVVTVGAQMRSSHAPPIETNARKRYPTLAQIAGHALNSIFLDALEADLERLHRINRTLSLVPPEALQRSRAGLRHIDVMVISPSEELEQIALRHIAELPLSIRLLFKSVGATERGGATLLSYLLFETGFCRELLALGYKDAMAKRENLLGFLGFHADWYCELRNTAA